MTIPTIDADVFDLIKSSECARWSDRSLAVVRLLLVDNVPLAEAAAAHDMTNNQASSIRYKFLKKLDDKKIVQFMAKEPPNDLSRFERDIMTLNKSGYSAEQIKKYLAKQNMKISLTKIRQFIKNMEGDK